MWATSADDHPEKNTKPNSAEATRKVIVLTRKTSDKKIEEIFCDLIEWKEKKVLFHNESERKNEWMNSWIAWDTILQKEEKNMRKNYTHSTL